MRIEHPDPVHALVIWKGARASFSTSMPCTGLDAVLATVAVTAGLPEMVTAGVFTTLTSCVDGCGAGLEFPPKDTAIITATAAEVNNSCLFIFLLHVVIELI